MMYTSSAFCWVFLLIVSLSSCHKNGSIVLAPGVQNITSGASTTNTQSSLFHFGADLSYVNQILDHGGIYFDQNEVHNPYRILHDHGATVARFRLWHNPVWTKSLYGTAGTQCYNDLTDLEKSIRLAKEQGMQVLVDLHYSDTWADPGRQEVPKAWTSIKDSNVLADSVYQYTLMTLQRLNSKALMPDMIQIGNEINCGMLYGNAPSDFPTCNACRGEWEQLGKVINSGIRAVRTVSLSLAMKPKILLHIADPKNVLYWFDTIQSQGHVTDFDVVGFSYYPLWHTTIMVDHLSNYVASFKRRYGKEVMLLETAYPWTDAHQDDYPNLFGTQPPIPGYPFTQQGQFEMLKILTQQVKDGGGTGIVYWEPAWISSNNRDLFGTGSPWENATLFDFNGKPTRGMDYMRQVYR